MAKFSPSISKLISELGQLPSIGQKTAQRLAFYLLSQPPEKANALADAIRDAREKTHFCTSCYNLTDEDPCPICQDQRRDQHTVLVVESPQDVAAFERTHEYHGKYHVLHGCINPMQGVGPDEIRLRELLVRLGADTAIDEIILAMNATVEGEATATYIARMLQGTGIKTTRLAHGLPMGANLEYADDVTLARALSGRQSI